MQTNCSFYIFQAQFTKMSKFLALLLKPATKITLEFFLIDTVSTVLNLIMSRWVLLLWESQEAEPKAAEHVVGCIQAGDGASSIVYGIFSPPLSVAYNWCWLLRNYFFDPISQLGEKNLLKWHLAREKKVLKQHTGRQIIQVSSISDSVPAFWTHQREIVKLFKVMPPHLLRSSVNLRVSGFHHWLLGLYLLSM